MTIRQMAQRVIDQEVSRAIEGVEQLDAEHMISIAADIADRLTPETTQEQIMVIGDEALDQVPFATGQIETAVATNTIAEFMAERTWNYIYATVNVSISKMVVIVNDD